MEIGWRFLGGQVELRCVRNPQGAMLVDARGNLQMDATSQGDAVLLDVGRHDLVQLCVEFR